MLTRVVGFLLLLVVGALAGCAQSYTTPGGPADFSALGLTPGAKAALTDASVQKILDKKPLVTFPATIAIARIQSPNYQSYTYPRRSAWNEQAAYSIVTARDVEKDEDIEKIGHLPQVAAAVTIKNILLQDAPHSDLALRAAAARLHANLLLFYTFDTVFDLETRVRPLGVISLGLFPNKNARVSITASAVLMDVNNGYVYSVVEATSKDNQLTNAWESEQSMDEVRRRVERDAFVKMIDQFRTEWPTVVATYTPRATAPAPTP